jgi:hypothetical protein
VIEIRVEGMLPRMGDPVFRRLDADLASALMSIGGIRGIEMGDGFAAARLHGSEFNDSPLPGGGWATNHAGGALGGISTGQPLVLRLAVRPTGSIGKPQDTIDRHGQATTIEIRGRHDPCLAPRIVPVAEAMVACVLADTLSRQAGIARVEPTADEWALEIDRCDEALLAALARRVEVSAARDRALGAVSPRQRKTVIGLPALRSAWARRARELGLPRELVRTILDAILRPSEG